MISFDCVQLAWRHSFSIVAKFETLSHTVTRISCARGISLHSSPFNPRLLKPATVVGGPGVTFSVWLHAPDELLLYTAALYNTIASPQFQDSSSALLLSPNSGHRSAHKRGTRKFYSEPNNSGFLFA